MAGCSCVNAAQIVSTLVSASTRSLSAGKSKRLARMATCASDSSPVTYSALPANESARAILVAVCSKIVDLPIPGSPPINTTEPATSPPPSTRSNSLIPVGRRVSSVTLTALSGMTAL